MSQKFAFAAHRWRLILNDGICCDLFLLYHVRAVKFSINHVEELPINHLSLPESLSNRPSIMDGRPLDHLELLTISEKDEQYYDSWIGTDIQELTQRCLGVRRWIQFRGAITFFSRFGYFAINSLLKKPTPGEEYCEAHVDRKQSNYYLKNLLVILLNNELKLPPEIPKSQVSLLRDFHLITFFLFGDFYELAKRVTNYSYTTFDTNSYQSKKMTYLYKLIGCMSLVKLVLNISKETQNMDRKASLEKFDEICPRIEKNTDSKITDSTMVCHLCSEQRTRPTSTICGHIFCWYCIHEWLKERLECPICKTPTEPSRLIFLINFR